MRGGGAGFRRSRHRRRRRARRAGAPHPGRARPTSLRRRPCLSANSRLRGHGPDSLLRIGTTLPNRHGSQTRPRALAPAASPARSAPAVPVAVRSVPRLHVSRLCSIHLTAPSSGSSLKAQGRNCASRPRVINPAPSRTFRCRETDCRLISKGSASTFTVARPWARRARMARLVGSASAAKVRSSSSSSTILSLSVDQPIG